MPLDQDIYDCMAADICYICRKPVEAGQAVYSITGAHWECHEKQRGATDKALQDAEAKLVGAQRILDRLGK